MDYDEAITEECLPASPAPTRTAAASAASRAFRREIRRLVSVRHTAASVTGTRCYAALPSSRVHERYAHTFGTFSGFFIVRGGNDALYMDAMLQQVAPSLPAGPERHVLRTASSLLRPLTQQLSLPVRAHSIANEEINNQAASCSSASSTRSSRHGGECTEQVSAVTTIAKDLAQRAFAIAQAVHAGPEPQMAVIMNPITFAPVCMMVNAACCAMIGAEPTQYHQAMEESGTLLRHGLLMDPDQALLVSALDLHNKDAAKELIRRGSCDPNVRAIAGLSSALPGVSLLKQNVTSTIDEDSLDPIGQNSDEAVMGDNSSTSGSSTTPAELASLGTSHKAEQQPQQDYQGGWHVVLDIMQRLVDASCTPMSSTTERITGGHIGEAVSTTHGAIAVPHGQPLRVRMTLSFHCLGARGCFPLCMTKIDASPLADPWGQLLPPAGGSLPTAGDTDYFPGVHGNPHASPSLAQYLAVRMLAGDPDASGAQEERMEHVHQFAHVAGWLGPVATAAGISVRTAAARAGLTAPITAHRALSTHMLQHHARSTTSGVQFSIGGGKRRRAGGGAVHDPVQLLGLAMRTLGGALEHAPIPSSSLPARAHTAVQAAVACMAAGPREQGGSPPPSQRPRKL